MGILDALNNGLTGLTMLFGVKAEDVAKAHPEVKKKRKEVEAQLKKANESFAHANSMREAHNKERGIIEQFGDGIDDEGCLIESAEWLALSEEEKDAQIKLRNNSK
jgi:hypothetical protein